MQMVSKRDLDSAELETMRTSKSPTKMMTTNDKMQTTEEATENIKELDLFVTVVLLEETPAVLFLGKLCEDHGYTYHWTSGQQPQLTPEARQSIALYQTMCHSLSLVYRRVPLHHPHLLLQHLHRKIRHLHRKTLYLTSADTRKIPHPKEVEVRVRSNGETRCIDQQKPKTQIKMKDTKKYRAIYCMNCRTGCRSSEKFWSMKVVL